MPISFFVALGAVVALGLGGLAYVWITSPPARKAQPEPELELFPNQAPPVERRRSSGGLMAGAGR